MAVKVDVKVVVVEALEGEVVEVEVKASSKSEVLEAAAPRSLVSRPVKTGRGKMAKERIRSSLKHKESRKLNASSVKVCPAR